MATAKMISPYDRLLNRVVETMTPEEIMAFVPTEEEQRRADELTTRNKEGNLSAEEADELQQMIAFNRLVTLLKVKAYTALHKS
jgi:hypothetical protein